MPKEVTVRKSLESVVEGGVSETPPKAREANFVLLLSQSRLGAYTVRRAVCNLEEMCYYYFPSPGW